MFAHEREAKMNNISIRVINGGEYELSGSDEIERYRRVLSDDAIQFVADLQRRFGDHRSALLNARKNAQRGFDCGELPGFLPETAHIRNTEWKVAPPPKCLEDRRVEITGPVDRKMMINALNSGAKVFMADFEDASSPTIENMLNGQINMMDYAAGELSHVDPKSGKSYRLDETTALMIVRPRGWHLNEAHVIVDGNEVAASLFDFGLHAFHNARALADQGIGPFYYLPKIESYLEARLWDDVFCHAEAALGLSHGTIKATVLVETLPAAFQMDEILYAMRHHIVGLNCGRWDYIFSYIKTLRMHREYVLPDRAEVVMDDAFLDSYSTLLIQTCHRRGAHAMGGMAAQIPIKGDEPANFAAFEKVRADKRREVELGHDGTWVAHPDLVPVALGVFNEKMPAANQISTAQANNFISEKMLLVPHRGLITEAGIRTNISIGIEYLSAWLRGRGAVPIHNLMEDAATAEISRSQIWQWLHHGCEYQTEEHEVRKFDRHAFDQLLESEINNIIQRVGQAAYKSSRYEDAKHLFVESAAGDELSEFLTIAAYEQLRQFPT